MNETLKAEEDVEKGVTSSYMIGELEKGAEKLREVGVLYCNSVTGQK